MFVLILTYEKGIDLINKHLQAHREFLDENYRSGKFICSGAQKPRTGGIIICNTTNRHEVDQIIARDPFFIHQAATYQVIEFETSKYAKGFEPFINS